MDVVAAVAAAAVATAADAAVFAAVAASKHYRCHLQLVGSVRFDFRLVSLPTNSHQYYERILLNYIIMNHHYSIMFMLPVGAGP